jgi:hypothetical protein
VKVAVQKQWEKEEVKQVRVYGFIFIELAVEIF